MIAPYHYRYSDVLSEDGMYIVLEIFRAIKETECGYWVQRYHGGSLELTEAMVKHMTAKATRPFNVRWVSKDSSRRYCYPDKALAMHSYQQRKIYQLKHARYSIARAEHALAAANKMLELGDCLPKSKWSGEIKLGMPAYFSGFTVYD